MLPLRLYGNEATVIAIANGLSRSRLAIHPAFAVDLPELCGLGGGDIRVGRAVQCDLPRPRVRAHWRAQSRQSNPTRHHVAR